MAKDTKQLEKNVSASFGYVKKDLLMLNDAISDLHDKIQHLSLNHANLLGKIQSMEKRLPKAKVAKKKVAKKSTKKKVAKKSVKPVKKVVTETVTYA